MCTAVAHQIPTKPPSVDAAYCLYLLCDRDLSLGVSTSRCGKNASLLGSLAPLRTLRMYFAASQGVLPLLLNKTRVIFIVVAEKILSSQ